MGRLRWKVATRTRAAAASFVLVLLLAGCDSSPKSSATSTATQPGLEASTDSTDPGVDFANTPGEPSSAVVTPPTIAAGPYPHDSYHPDLSMTPGAVFAGATAAQVCVSGYSASVRNVTSATKARVFAEYGISNPAPGAYEVDHLVSLELGGSNDIRNLWPEPYLGPDNAHVKDTVENRLHAQVCSGLTTLQAAQLAIIDWDGQLAVSIAPPTAAVPTADESTTASPSATTTLAIVPPAGGLPIVSGGAFCAPVGATGVTTTGTMMVCSLTSKAGTVYTDGRARWHTP